MATSPEIKDISSPLTIISGITYYTPEQLYLKRIQYGGDHRSICKEACSVPWLTKFEHRRSSIWWKEKEKKTFSEAERWHDVRVLIRFY